MEAMRQSWSDDRLDDLKDRVETGFAQMDQRSARIEARLEAGFDRLDAKIDAKIGQLDAKIDAKIGQLDAKIDSKVDGVAAELRQEMKSGFDGVDRRFDAMQQRFDAMQQTIIRVGGGLIGVLVAGFIAARF
jgi:tetrahydromethanopterin S-methyltransferase subunit G